MAEKGASDIFAIYLRKVNLKIYHRFTSGGTLDYGVVKNAVVKAQV